MSKNAYANYADTSVLSADGITLTTMLYDASLKAIKKARLHHESGNRDGYVRELERIHLILGELLATLDMSQGEIPERLSGIYTYCMKLTVQATVKGPSELAEVEMLIGNIATAWKTATAALKGTAPGARNLADAAA